MTPPVKTTLKQNPENKGGLSQLRRITAGKKSSSGIVIHRITRNRHTYTVTVFLLGSPALKGVFFAPVFYVFLRFVAAV